MGLNTAATGHRLYRGERTKDDVVITVHRAPGDFRALDDGLVDGLTPAQGDEHEFDWGRASAGTERLAAALLRDALDGTVERALVRQLADEVVAGLPYLDPWVLWSEDLETWARAKGA